MHQRRVEEKAADFYFPQQVKGDQDFWPIIAQAHVIIFDYLVIVNQ